MVKILDLGDWYGVLNAISWPVQGPSFPTFFVLESWGEAHNQKKQSGRINDLINEMLRKSQELKQIIEQHTSLNY